jgi:hypothetical protein
MSVAAPVVTTGFSAAAAIAGAPSSSAPAIATTFHGVFLIRSSTSC